MKTLNNAAVLAVLNEESGRAEKLFQRAIAVSEARLISTDPLYGQVLGVYAQFLRQTNRPGEAKPLERRAKGILEAFRRETYVGLTVEASSLLPKSQASGRH